MDKNVTTAPVQQEQFVDLSKLKFAPAMVGMERFWISTGDRAKLECEALESKSSNVYLKSVDGVYYVNSGRAFSTIQQIPIGEQLNIIANVMKPNGNITDADIKSVEAKFGNNLDEFRKAQKEGYVQLHYAREIA